LINDPQKQKLKGDEMRMGYVVAMVGSWLIGIIPFIFHLLELEPVLTLIAILFVAVSFPLINKWLENKELTK